MFEEDEWFLKHLGKSNLVGKMLVDKLCSEALSKGDIQVGDEGLI